MFTLAVLTVSDRSSKGQREDLSAPEIKEWAGAHGIKIISESIVPDELGDIKKKLIEYSDKGISLILTTGGTGFAPRDVTPEATRSVIERIAPGFAEVMRMKSMEITPHGMLSRAVAGIRKQSLIVNLPGSPRAVRENLTFIEKAIPHALELLKGDVTDCGSD